MSDDFESPNDRFVPLTFKEVSEFLEWKSGNIVCEICENDAWGLMNAVEEGFVLSRLNLRNHTPTGKIALFVMECTNCGNLKLFRQHGIREKLVARRLDATKEKES